MLPKVKIACVDVRDVAMAHLLALKKPEAANKRFCLVNKSLWFTELGAIIAKDFKPMGYSCSTKECPWLVAKMGSWFMAELASMMKTWGIDSNFENTQSREILGIDYSISMETTIKEMVESMMDTGVIEDKRKK